MKGNGQPLYEYAPLDLENYDKHQLSWQDEMMEKNKELTWIKNIYWKLDQLSCVLVLRNKLWFSLALSQITDVWNTIEAEKKSGFAHRAPKKNNTVKVKKLSANLSDIEMSSKCFITIDTTE
jgi:hypothetical protein